MLSEGKSPLLDSDILDRDRQVIEDISESELETDKNGIEIGFDLTIDRVGASEDDITDSDYYETLYNHDEIQRIISLHYARFKDEDGRIRSHSHLIQNIALDIKKIDSGIEDGDIKRLGRNICGSEYDEDDGIQCIAMKMITNGN